ncbi:MAG: D-tyrosyl-tRNA(Tyr) deacylase [Clostridia bacterium]|nr:D-tyrosyl-tRNA(Tyr) deacylase [Clostridia bacterium]
MRAVIQRVSSADVTVDGAVVASVGHGFLVLLGVMDGDTEKEAELLARKTAALRVFCDSEDKMNLSIIDIGGEILSVSQFTLCADVKKGNRPSFTPSAPPDEAQRLYKYFNKCLIENGVRRVAEGVFGADMKVGLVNDGPVTIIYDTEIWSKSK